MNINVHIERVILEGVPIAAASHGVLRKAIESELVNLLAREGLPGIAAGAVPHLSGGAFSLTTDGKPAQIGSQIAHALHRAVIPAGIPSAAESGRGSRENPLTQPVE